jgi:hypothetical protein
MGRHRRDELETQTSPDDDQLAAAWRLHFPLDLMNPAVCDSPAKEWPEVDTSTYPIRFLDTLKLTIEGCVFDLTKGQAVTRYADVTDSGLPASDTAPTQVLVTMPTKTGGPVTLLAALAEHPVHKDAYHVQLLVCKGERALEDGAVAATLHHTVVCALGVLPTRPALGFIVKDIWNNAGAYLRGRRAFMHTISLDDTHPAPPVATRYKIGYEATPPAGLYQP